jgi:hypothetical protein
MVLIFWALSFSHLVGDKLKEILQDPKYNTSEAIDRLHAIVDEAKKRKVAGVDVPNAWREDLPPRNAIAARTVPVLKKEVEWMKAKLALVFEFPILYC